MPAAGGSAVPSRHHYLRIRHRPGGGSSGRGDHRPARPGVEEPDPGRHPHVEEGPRSGASRRPQHRVRPQRSVLGPGVGRATVVETRERPAVGCPARAVPFSRAGAVLVRARGELLTTGRLGEAGAALLYDIVGVVGVAHRFPPSRGIDILGRRRAAEPRARLPRKPPRAQTTARYRHPLGRRPILRASTREGRPQPPPR